MRRPLRHAIPLFLVAALAASCGGSGGGQSASAAGGMPRIGVALDAGGAADLSVNRSARDGALRLAREAGGRVEGEPDASWGDALSIRLAEVPDGSDRRALLRSLAAEGRDLVFAVGFLFSDSLMSVAREFPSVRFVLVDGFVPDLTAGSNITCVSFAEQDGAFLMGAAAGLLTIDRGPGTKVGFIGGMDTPVSRRYLAGFMAGAGWSNPGLRRQDAVVKAFLGRGAASFGNAQQAAFYTSSLVQKAGITVIFNVTGAAGLGVVETAARLGATVLGADLDQAALLSSDPDPAKSALASAVAASMLKRVDRVVFDLGRALVNRLPAAGGYQTLGLADGGVSWVSGGLSPELRSALAELAGLVASGDILVPRDEESAATFVDGLR